MKWIEYFYKQFNVKLVIKRKMYCGANADTQKRTINIAKRSLRKGTTPYLVHLVAHELCHILSNDHNKYKKYYTQKCTKSHIRKIGLKAERYTDKMADKMVRSFFPDLPLCTSYRTVKAKKWYQKHYLNPFFGGNYK